MVKQYNLKFQGDNNQNYFKLNHAIENQCNRESMDEIKS